MLKAKRLKKGDKVAIVSLSSGILGENFCSHYIELGQSRIKEFGLVPVFMPNALKGMDFIDKHPEKRAEDLKTAFLDDDIKGIICAIGGLDTFRTIEYLLGDDEFINAVKNNPKLFTGFSDSTVNHLMFYKLGLTTYYGPNYINDFSEMASDMLAFTKNAIKNYYFAENIHQKIISSDVWYEERTDFSPNSMGTNRIIHKEDKGYELLQGKCPFEGELLGGCLESLAELNLGGRNSYQKEVNEKYNIFPLKEEWKGKILFLETSEEKPNEDEYKTYLRVLKDKGVFENINGIIHGKPQNEVNYELYKKILVDEVGNKDLPILFNVNFGHAYPRTVLAYGVKVLVNENYIEYIDNCID
ncbi:MAG: carboxypeptidase [Clostridiales bacterium]|nr:MAG: carboxypeptidase [Clostridiales bacterium]